MQALKMRTQLLNRLQKEFEDSVRILKWYRDKYYYSN